MIKYIFLVLFCAGFVNASYVGILMKVNSIIESKKNQIPGVDENDVQAHVVIPHYVVSLNKYIETQSDQAKPKYAKTREILNIYQEHGTDSDNYKIEERKDGISFRNCDLSKVDWFLKQIFNTFEGMWYPSESPVFSMLYYVHHYHTIKDQFDTLKKEIDHFAKYNEELELKNKELTKENEEIDNLYVSPQKSHEIAEESLRYQNLQMKNEHEKALKELREENLALNREYTNYKEQVVEQLQEIQKKNFEALNKVNNEHKELVTRTNEKIKVIEDGLAKNNSQITLNWLFIAILFISNAYLGYAYYTR